MLQALRNAQGNRETFISELMSRAETYGEEVSASGTVVASRHRVTALVLYLLVD